MLKMSGRLMVTSTYTPTVILHIDLSVTQCNHWLDGYAHTLLELCAITATPIIGNTGILMHFPAYAVSDKFPDNAISVAFTVRLYGITYITKALAGYSLLYSEIERFLGNFKEFPNLGSDFTYCKCVG